MAGQMGEREAGVANVLQDPKTPTLFCTHTRSFSGVGVSNSKQFSNRLTSNSKGGPWGGEYFSLVPDHHL